VDFFDHSFTRRTYSFVPISTVFRFPVTISSTNEKIQTNSDKTRFVISLAFSFARPVQVNSASTASGIIIMNACLIFPVGFFHMEIFDFSRKASNKNILEFRSFIIALSYLPIVFGNRIQAIFIE
jgi:hypothetical protein